MPPGCSYFTVVAIEASLFLTRVHAMSIYYGRSDPPLLPRVKFLLQIRHISYLCQENTEDIPLHESSFNKNNSLKHFLGCFVHAPVNIVLL